MIGKVLLMWSLWSKTTRIREKRRTNCCLISLKSTFYISLEEILHMHSNNFRNAMALKLCASSYLKKVSHILEQVLDQLWQDRISHQQLGSKRLERLQS